MGLLRRLSALFGRDLLATVLAAALLAVAELVAIGSFAPGVVAATTVLLMAVGVTCGLVISFETIVVQRLSPPEPARVLILAAGASVPLYFVASTLFEGSRASTMPGASSATLWLPAIGVVVIAIAIWVARITIRNRGAGARRVVGAACVLGAVIIELANRRLFRSEYADVHAFLIVVSLVLLAVALRLLVSSATSCATPRLGTATLAAHLVLFAATLAAVWAVGASLSSSDDRRAIATGGSHARHLVRLARAAMDADQDGFSSAFGGGDCDDGDASRNPGATEIAGNGIDEDCDGEDLAPVEPTETDRSLAELEREWQDSDGRAALIARTSRLNVLMISIDTLRADVLTDPASKNRYPRLTELRDQSRAFARAFSSSAGTDLSVSSIITGRINPFVELDTTLIEAMAASGRKTHALLPSEVLRYAGKTLLTRGLDERSDIISDKFQRDVGSYTTSRDTTSKALRALDGLRQQPFFLWVHYFDIHEHHQIEVDDADLRGIAGDRDLSSRSAKYHILVELTDREVGRLLDGLAERDLADSTIVVAFSDHGESMHEDPRLPEAHGRFVYNTLTHVPLWIRVPGVSPAQIDQPVSLLDLTPTIFELVGLPVESWMDGRTLLPFLSDDSDVHLREAPRRIVLNEQEQWGVIEWPYKLMFRPAENLMELYDLSSDFAEHNNLIASEPELAQRLKASFLRAPQVTLDRTRAGRKKREQLARPPRKR